MEESGSDEKDIYGHTKATKFQFKSASKKRLKRVYEHFDAAHDHRRHSSKRSHSEENHSTKYRHSAKKRKPKHDDSPHTFSRNGEYDNPNHRHRESIYDHLNENSPRSPSLDPDAAFRESLFDAMADDEGAEYWESVYGQPVHIYPNTKPGPDGKLERMSDEEYAEFVRTKMWERSHQHILEERAARERARQERKYQDRHLEEEAVKEDAEREKIRRQMEESLKRGAERKKAKEIEAAWEKYLRRWEDFRRNQESEREPREIIPWPVASCSASQVETRSIEHFLASSPAWRNDPLALLKAERVRWHPDKMQQRFGRRIDPGTMKLVTAVFQVIDRLWKERTGRGKR